jgi:hypothetical protein
VHTATYEFTREDACRLKTSISASTDAHAVLLNWSMTAQNRSFHAVLDLPDRLVATLSWAPWDDESIQKDLHHWCRKLDIRLSHALRLAVARSRMAG